MKFTQKMSNKMSNKMLGAALSSALLLAACGPQPNTGNPPTGQEPSAQSFESQIQVALSSYHESDASFQSTHEAEASGQFRTQQLILDGSGELLLDSALGTQLSNAINLSANAETTLETYKNIYLGLESQLESGGSFQIDSSGNVSVNASTLESRVNSENDQSLVLQLNGMFDLGRNDLQVENKLQTELKSYNNTGRLESRQYSALAGEFDGAAQANQDYFAAHFSGSASDRDVLLVVESNGGADTQSDFSLREQGQSFSRRGERNVNFESNGSARLFTHVDTQINSGDRVQFFEERVVDAQGNGAGGGTLLITTQEGGRYEGQIRTMSSADGSLSTWLDSSNSSQADFLLRENAQGQAEFSVIQNGQVTETQSLNMQAMAEASNSTNFQF